MEVQTDKIQKTRRLRELKELFDSYNMEVYDDKTKRELQKICNEMWKIALSYPEMPSVKLSIIIRKPIEEIEIEIS